MERRTVELRLAGQSYRVVTTATDEELAHLLSVVEEKLNEVTPAGRRPAPDAMLLVALALVHELEEARERVREVEGRARQLFERMLAQIDAALETEDATPEQPTALPPSI